MNSESNEKPKLSAYITEVILATYGSVIEAARSKNLSYEHLKKALRANRFRKSLIEVLLPSIDFETVQNTYEFTLARRQNVRNTERSTRYSWLLSAIGEENLQMMEENKWIQEEVISVVLRECQKWRSLFDVEK